MKIFNRIDTKIRDTIFLATIGIVTIFWFKQDYINGGDFSYPMAPMGDAWVGYANIWTDKWGLGLVNSRALPQLPFMVLFTLVGKAGLSTAFLERVLFYTLFTMPAVSVYFLVDIMPFDDRKRMTAVFSSLFYMFNPFNIIFYWHILDGMIFVYAFLPALLVSYLKWFRTRNPLYAVLFVGLSTVSGYTFSNPLIVLILWFLLLVFTFTLKGSDGVVKCLRFYLGAGVVWSILSGWWLIPLLGSMQDEFSGLSATIGTPLDTLNVFSSHASLLNLLRISDLYWAFTDTTILGDPYYKYAWAYSTISFTLIGFILPLVMFAPLLLGFKPGKSLPMFLLATYAVTIGYIFLAKGTHEPLGRELYYIIFKIPFLSAFRAPVHKLIVLISINYAILFGCGMVSIYLYLERKGWKAGLSYAAIGAIAVPALVIYPYPLWTGDVIHDGGKNYPSYHVSVPSYLYEAANFIDTDPEYFRFYSLPQSPTFNVVYNWDQGYIGSDPKQFIFSKPGVYSTVDDAAQMPYKLLHDTEDKNIYKLLRLQNIKYILLHNDINEKLWNVFTGRQESVEYLKKRLNEQNNLEFVKSFGKLDVYKISDRYFLPHIYSSNNFTIVPADVSSLASILDTVPLDNRPAIIFTEQKDKDILGSLAKGLFDNKRHNLAIGGDTAFASNKEHIKSGNNVILVNIAENAPVIGFKKVSPTKYIADVNNAKGPFIIVLSESYHKGWRAYIRQKAEGERRKAEEKEPLSLLWSAWKDKGDRNEIKDHFLVNGYANGWVVPGLEVGGKRFEEEGAKENFQIVLEFKPQRLFEVGLLISAITLIGCIGYLGYDFRKRRQLKRKDLK